MSETTADSHFLHVTEVAGEPISGEQLERLEHRYAWAAEHCVDRDVLEVACGTGPGLGVLLSRARSVQAGDVSPPILEIARRHYGSRVALSRIDAHALPCADASKDVILLFEALYYLADPNAFFRECRRVLRPDGRVLIATANKDLSDFSPSPHSHRYFGAGELAHALESNGFSPTMFGHLSVRDVTLRQKVLRPIKRIVVGLGLMPRTMRGKRLLKRLVFGKPVVMPREIAPEVRLSVPPTPIACDRPDFEHKVIYAVGTLRNSR